MIFGTAAATTDGRRIYWQESLTKLTARNQLKGKIGEQTWQPNVLYALAEGPRLEPERLHYMTRPHLGSRRHRIGLGHAKWIRSTADVPGR